MESEAEKRKTFNSVVFNYLATVSDEIAIDFVRAVHEVNVEDLPNTDDVIQQFVEKFGSKHGCETQNGKARVNEAMNTILNGKAKANLNGTENCDEEQDRDESVSELQSKSFSEGQPDSRKRKSSPFRRVRAETVQVASVLQDNSYAAKKGAHGAYGERANEVLKTVHGRDFRHEKTKKKRGTYRGGLIDMHAVHSIRFDEDD